MTVQEALQKKEQLERRIEEMLEEFSRETGLTCSKLQVHCTGIYSDDEECGKDFSYHVTSRIIL